MARFPALLFLSLLVASHTFTCTSTIRRVKIQSSSTWLTAKKNPGKTIAKRQEKSRGGFGKTDTSSGSKGSTKSREGDYSVFPALEPDVLATLVPQTSCSSSPGLLPEEIYQRINQIYGFPYFNFPQGSLSNQLSIQDMLLASNTEAQGMLDATSPSYERLSIDRLPSFDNIRVLHIDPLVLAVDDFFSDDEADRYVAMSTKTTATGDAPNNNQAMQARSPTVGKDAAAKAQRTSTTWYHHFENVPELMAKASRLLGLDKIDRFEEPQTVRYRRNEKFTWHLDALGPMENQPHLGGQRLATLLVYLTDLKDGEGGATLFRDLGGLRVQPKKGSALLFFPAAGGIPNTPFDIRTLHCGEAVSDDSSQDKWIAQLWLRASPYKPTAPPGNTHANAQEAIRKYCSRFA